jgi:hypothetical protein
MDPNALMAMLQAQAAAQEGAEIPQPDTAETVQISSFCLLKALRHGECAGSSPAGPLEASNDWPCSTENTGGRKLT